MAKKGFIKDQNDVEILPITRGELVIDSSGKEAFHSNDFLATTSQPGLMSAEDKNKLDNLEEGIKYDIVSTTADGLAPKINTTASAITTQTDEWVLTTTKGATPSWRKLPVNAFLNRPISVNGTSILENNNTALNLVAGNNITLVPEKDTGKVTIHSNITNITGNAATADKLKNKVKLWGQDFDGTADVNGTIYVNNIRSKKTQRNLILYDLVLTQFGGVYDGEITKLVGQNIYFDSGDPGTATTTMVITDNGNVGIGTTSPEYKLDVNGNVRATSFIGNLDGAYINKLTGYTKATTAADLVETDTLNIALGKLEYKADVAYSWYRSITQDDTDEIINKWDEVVDFVNGLEVDLTEEFVTRKTNQTIIGEKIFSGTSDSLLTIDRNSDNPPWVKFAKNNNVLGYIGITHSKNPVVNIDGKVYYILHAGNFNSYTPKLDGTGATGTWNIGLTGKNITSEEELDALINKPFQVAYIENSVVEGFSDGIILSTGVNNRWGHQIYLDDNREIFRRRSKNGEGSAWYPWRDILDSGNYTRYTVKKDGTGATGTWSINITGSAESSLRCYPQDSLLKYSNGYTVEFVKEEIVKLLAKQSEGVGYNITVPVTVINNWNDPSYITSPSSAYSLIKISGSYSGSTYGQYLLSSHYTSKIGYVGRNNDVWSSIKWLATTEDIDSLRNYYWADIKISSSANANTSPTFAYPTSKYLKFTNGTESIGYVGRGSSNNNLYFSNYTKSDVSIFTDNNETRCIYLKTGGNVGIGTTNPGYKLEVNGTIRSHGDILSAASDSTQRQFKAINAKGELWCGINPGGEGFLWLTKANTLVLGTNNKHQVDIHSTGNVSIGTSNAVNTDRGYRLDVLGNMRVGSDVTFDTKLTLNGISIYKSQDDVLYIDGNLAVRGGITSNLGFIKSNSSDSYILLGGGGHKAISDFLLKSELANQELSNNLTTITKELTVTQDWMDTGIDGDDFATGTYIVQVSCAANTGSFYDCYWSGVMSWWKGRTNDTESDEIILHRAGRDYSNTVYLRTIMRSNTDTNGLKLQIAANKNIGAAYTYTFKFKRII